MPREIKHGRSGYRLGCKCPTCRAGNARAVADWRARKKAGQAPKREYPMPEPLASAPALDPDAPPGRLEQLLSLDLAQPPSAEPSWKAFLAGLALFNARMLDQLPRMERLDLVSPIETRTLEILTRLRPPEPRNNAGAISDDDLQRFIAGLNSAE